MTPLEILKALQKNSAYRGQLRHQEYIPAREASFGRLRPPLPPWLKNRLSEVGVDRLYRHQAEAIRQIRAGANVILVSGTASGKTLSYNIPVLETLLNDPKATVFYVYPTKALAQDQLRVLQELLPENIKAFTYDGDTPFEDRANIRRTASLVLTNPDMLHQGILPHHRRWGRFFLNLAVVVVDEVHSLRGVFGSQVAQVIRRLRRVSARYGRQSDAGPQFVLASATVANPHELGENLLGLPVAVVSGDTSPAAEKYFIFWNPPLLDEKVGRRRSSNVETTQLFGEFLSRGERAIAFSKSRKSAELVYRYARDGFKNRPALAERIAPYRGGYLPQERREIEARLFAGELVGVSTTNALELGIDVGSLDVCLINGFPGTITSAWQQAGRAGRREGQSLAALIAQDDPLDQYYMSHPEDFFGKSHEDTVIDPSNPYILESHLACAAYEYPLEERDERFFGPYMSEAWRKLEERGTIKVRKGKAHARAGQFPAADVSLRSVSQDDYRVIDADSGQLLATLDANRAFMEVHPGAIYLHQGQSYLVLDLDIQDKAALVTQSNGDYYTQPRDRTSLTISEKIKQRRVGRTQVFLGTVEVTTRVIGFQKRDLRKEQTLGTYDLDLPEGRFRTEAFWFLVPHKILGELRLPEPSLAGGLHALEHAAIGLLPLFATCDRWDVGGVSTPLHSQTGRATIFIYDGYAGGVGLASRGYARFKEHMKATWKGVRACPCDDGCPSCVQSPKCGNWNEPLDKEAALRILESLIPEVTGDEQARKVSRSPGRSRVKAKH